MEIIKVRSSGREEFVNITAEVARMVSERGPLDGAVIIYCPHTTAGITINEAADPSVVGDMLASLRGLVPRHGDYRHAEGNSDAHVKASLIGSSAMVIIDNGKLVLGTWQGIFFTEFDGPRSREVRIKFIKDRS